MVKFPFDNTLLCASLMVPKQSLTASELRYRLVFARFSRVWRLTSRLNPKDRHWRNLVGTITPNHLSDADKRDRTVKADSRVSRKEVRAEMLYNQ